jgi:transposase-like protein
MPRYPDAMRQFAVTYAQSTGVGLGMAADQLGISDVTLRSWMRAPKRAGAFLPVVVADELEPQSQTPPSSSSSTTLTLRTVQGHELGPLDVDTAIALLRALS